MTVGYNQTTMNEVWKPVVGFEGLYEVSNQGRVRSLLISDKHGATSGHCLKAGDVRGYRQVILRKEGRSHSGLVHRLVAMAFVGLPPTPKHQVNHKDLNKSNNVPENLEWVTQTQNNRHAAPLIPRLRGEANHSKLTEDQVREIRRRYAAGGVTQQALADEFGVSNPTCNLIIRRIKWKHVA